MSDSSNGKIITPEQFTRIANNFYIKNGISVDSNRIALDSHFYNYINDNLGVVDKQYKIAFVFICLNPLYWQYAKEMVDSAKIFFLPGHKTDFLFWTDIPESAEKATESITNAFKSRRDIENLEIKKGIKSIVDGILILRRLSEVNIFPTDAVDWPYPTLLRYNLFLQQEEKLKEYDYIFYCDIDMKFVDVVGDEILGDGITAVQHPMYALDSKFCPPYEPNDKSASYIKRPGKLINNNGKSRFMPLYFAGGFQGGKADKFIEAMKATKKIIEYDLDRNYIPIWNDESAWNKHLSENPPEIVLTPSYTYPDTLVKEYFEPIWGRSYQPKLVTLTKWFTTSVEGGNAVKKTITQLNSLQK